MKIGIAGPVSLEILRDHVAGGERLPKAYSFPLIAFIAEELLRQGHDVVVFALSRAIEKPEIFRGKRLTVHIIPLRKRARFYIPDLYSRERQGLTQAMRGEACEVIHAQWTREFALAALASGTPCVITAHDAPFNVLRYVRPFWLRFIQAGMALIVCSKAAFLTAVSPYVESHYKNLFRFSGMIRVIPNGVPDNVFAHYIKRAEKKNEKFTFAVVLTNWDKGKNGKAALLAFGEFYKQNANSSLLMLGGGQGPGEEAEKWATEHGLEKGVQFVGFLSHNKLIKRLADEVHALIHPAVEEAFGMAVIEAMALGIPVIGGRDSGGVPYVLGYGKAGMLVNVRSCDEIYEAMEKISRDREYYNQLSQDSRAYALAHYRLEDIVKAYVCLYHDAIKYRAEQRGEGIVGRDASKAKKHE